MNTNSNSLRAKINEKEEAFSLQNHARELAQLHNWLGLKKKGKSLLPIIKDQGSYIKNSYTEINEYYYKTEDIIPAAEWYLDNFYIINDLINDITKDLSKKFESKLLYLASGDFAEHARIYVILSEYMKMFDKIELKHLREYIAEYQKESPLSSAEIWAIPIFLKVIMLEKINHQVERIIHIQKERRFAEDWLSSVLGQKTENIELLSKPDLDVSQTFSPVFIEKVAKRLKEHGSDAKILLNWLDNVADKQNMSVEKVISNQNYYLTSNGITMGNLLATIKIINSENWAEFFEGVSLVQQILNNDPADVFRKMDFESRDKYRHEIEILAEKYRVSEITIAKTLEKLAQKVKESPLNHVGYYLLGKGRIQLEKELANEWGKVRKSCYELLFFYKNRPSLAYIGFIAIATFLPLIGLSVIAYRIIPHKFISFIFMVLPLSLVLLNGISVCVINKLFLNLLPATFLPKLDFGNGIPEENKTIVVVPVIFNDPQNVIEQINQLEVHYLCNPEPNLYFAILGDFKDAPKEKMPNDNKIIDAGITAIRKLNRKYENDKFFYFHRSRKWNEKEKIWMGWERKRGKLLEFNSLLLNEGETSYIVKSGNLKLLKNIKYVITLDSDTILPRGTAVRLIGTIAHPMQRAIIDEENNKVVGGYGIIQPRISITASSAFSTPFATLFSGRAGIDPYTCAISDIYQDLFGEGIFTGKGIYDLNVFQKIVKNRFPENTILSHDLLEGIFTRTALATDLQLFDGYPMKYISYVRRIHRWIRGDWQIARYILYSRIALISRWKIIDNLRRSLEAPSQLLLLFLAFTLFNDIYGFLVGLVLLSLCVPLFLNIVNNIINRTITLRILKYEMKVGFAQIFFTLAVLPHLAVVQVDAILRSIGRQIITRRKLLEWETSADSEINTKCTLKNFYLYMSPNIIVILIFFLGFYYVDIFIGAILSILATTWLVSPYIAYRLSLPYKEEVDSIPLRDKIELKKISRQIWAFFDLFVNEQNNFLPPDNVQLDPYKGVAPRTSPTNIGLTLLTYLVAEDFGYITKKNSLEKIRKTLNTIKKLPKWKGHIYNWYTTDTLEPLHPIYVSTVDNGNFATYLIALKNGLKEFTKRPLIEKSMLEGIKDTRNLIKVNTEEIKNLIKEFDNELGDLENNFDLRNCYAFTSKWVKEFSQFKDNIEEEKDKIFDPYNDLFWIIMLKRMLGDFQRAIETYFPYLIHQETIANLPNTLINPTSVTLKELVYEYVKFLRGYNKPYSKEFKLLKKALKYTIICCIWISKLHKELEDIAFGMDFKFLYDKQKKLFSIGYNLTEKRLDKSYYDLLASEARQTSLFAIAKGDVPEEHWFKMSRPLTRINGYRSLVSWSGTMFEFLMPVILFKNYKGTLLDETYKSVVKIQQSYADRGQMPWGISESGFFSFDIQSNYQYKAFGVPGLGLKRGLAKDMVISPYSTFMALTVDFRASMDNIKYMNNKGFNGLYGLYEAIDYTKSRVPYNEKYRVVKSYMAHHQGMSLISLANALMDNIIQKRFHQEPTIKSVELLLQEQVPLKEYTFNPNIEQVSEEKVPVISKKKTEQPTRYFTPFTRVPRTSLLSNREYSVMITLAGSGYSKYNDLFVTRWREDPTVDMYGSYIYVQNLNSGNVWSATYKPVNQVGDTYKVACFPNNIEFWRKDGNIITQTEVFVTPEDPVEIRKVSITNESQYARDIQLTTYSEVVLDQLKADIAHPSFSKLFIQTRYEKGTIVAFRRPRHQDKAKVYVMHTFFTEEELLGEPEYETDRTKFIGRGRDLTNPRAMDLNQPLSNTVGAVLDPILSLRCTIRVKPGSTVTVYFLTGLGYSKQCVLRLAEKYRNNQTISQAKELSWSQSLMELTNLSVSFTEANILSSLAGQIIYPSSEKKYQMLKHNVKGQSSLWAYGLSGDLPIVLMKIQDNNQIKYIEQILRIHEYWKIKGLFIDLVILNEDKTGYFQTIHELIQEKVSFSHARRLVNKPGGVFLLKSDQLSREILVLLHTVARLIFSAENGSLYNQIYKLIRSAEKILPSQKSFNHEIPVVSSSAKSSKFINARYDTGNGREETDEFNLKKREQLEFYNEYGGFSKNGREYVIILEKEKSTPLPWVNVIANQSFGTVISEAGSSFSWSQNSREYKLSPWSNDPLLDTSGEAIYLKEEDTKKFWSPMPQPIRNKNPYIIRHGQGYSVFEHTSNTLYQETTVFVPLKHNLKIVKLKLKNLKNLPRKIYAYYYIEWVLGVSKDTSAPYLLLEKQEDIVFCRNTYQEEFSGRVAFLTAIGGKYKSCTADRLNFIGLNSNLTSPLGLQMDELDGNINNIYDPCTAIQIEINLQSGEEKNIYFVIGDAENKKSAINVLNTFKNQTSIIENFLQEVIDYWDNLLSTITVQTPERSFDLLFNRWLLYQILACRIWARSAFYQSGGAYGYRDQLQDVMALAIIRPEITKKQIVLHSSRQFPEGDVQHWWHPETGKGIRTKFSDDLLWLPYVTADYIRHTGDYTILEDMTPFLEQDLLKPEEDERYDIPKVSREVATVYDHCVRAIDRSLMFGQHGLPLIGTGDWNDGFSAVGREGKGESVWLGWFLLTILKDFIPICKVKEDYERVQKYEEIIEDLAKSIEKYAWDGSWYRRAYYDDGTPLGTMAGSECQIDSIAQSWAVISGFAKKSRMSDAMLALERYLWDKEESILKLFTPPFDKTEKNPGYIKSYTPGVRENGGQYTHAAIWAVLALTKLKDGDKAFELFNMLNPINHARTNTEVLKYKVEPYVMTADIYSVFPNVGRGGWSWYTGAAGWMYQVALEGILGFNLIGDELWLNPCVPLNWQEYNIKYRFGSSLYNITVGFNHSAPTAPTILVDNIGQTEFPIKLIDDGAFHTVKIFFNRETL